MTQKRVIDEAPTLAAFQRAAVDHIVARLRDPRGSRRFLLADEVGLGKTIVARGVIDALAATSETSLRVVYLCSNTEIAQQNRSKLVASGGQTVARTSDLAFIDSLGKRGRRGDVQLFAFTPATSLRAGTGLARERRLLLFLLDTLDFGDCSDPAWQEFFRCTAKAEPWVDSVKRSALRRDFEIRLSPRVLAAFRKCATGSHRQLFADIAKAVLEFDYDVIPERKRRNVLVGELRVLLQRLTLELINPHLVLLDEVQRFKDVIDHAHDSENLSSVLLRSGTPVLILSATPYRMLTLANEEGVGQHHEDFFTTLRFLLDKDHKALEHIRQSFLEFGVRMKVVPLNAERDERLLQLKAELEGALRKIICRTERNWYYSPGFGGVKEICSDSGSLPTRHELKEFFDIHRTLSQHLDGVGQVTDFWKSAPALLTFMDKSYALPTRLQKSRALVPRGLLASGNDPELPERNRRLKALIRHSLGTEDQLPFLWTKPAYTYHVDQAFGDSPPRKMLVFSGWRFVPKAISVAVSSAAARRFKKKLSTGSQPLRFAETYSAQTLDLCLPSLALAQLVDPLQCCLQSGSSIPSAAHQLALAEVQIRSALQAHGISVTSSGRGTRLWEVAMRLEQKQGDAQRYRDALDTWDFPNESPTSIDQNPGLIRTWIDSRRSLVIRERDIRKLACLSLASPAVTFLRTLLRTYEPAEVRERFSEIWALCFDELRRYLNRRVVQQVVNQYKNKLRDRARMSVSGYGGKVLTYSLDHHLQAVLDEHAHLLHGGGQTGSLTTALDHFRNVWSLGQGTRRTNATTSGKEYVRLGNRHEFHETHFALGFGEELEAEAAQSTDTPVGDSKVPQLRRTEVREAFNSPFWPFVLATTSIGQEGLDFHLHCHDVFHWNLPSNPVDLEQREGRVNRRNGLAVRQSIAKDWPLSTIAKPQNSAVRNPWRLLFDQLECDTTAQRHKQGLYPNWIYECRDPRDTVCVARHVAFFGKSRDIERYARLKNKLALYRLAFGQVDQEHLLGDLDERLQQLSAEEQAAARHSLRGYMLSLSPITRDVALKFAQTEARVLLDSGDAGEIRQLLAEVRTIASEHPVEFAPVSAKLAGILAAIDAALNTAVKIPKKYFRVLSALAYVRNPYDAVFDTHGIGGFDDDVEVLRSVVLPI